MKKDLTNIKIKKEGGIVILVTISYITSIVLSFNSFTEMIFPFSFDENWLKISNLALDSYNKQWINLILFNQMSNILILILSIVLVILFVKQSRFISNALIAFFISRIILMTLTFYFQTVVKGPPTPELLEIGSSIIRALVIPGLWIPYFMLSEKVGETFIY